MFQLFRKTKNQIMCSCTLLPKLQKRRKAAKNVIFRFNLHIQFRRQKEVQNLLGRLNLVSRPSHLLFIPFGPYFALHELLNDRGYH